MTDHKPNEFASLEKHLAHLVVQGQAGPAQAFIRGLDPTVAAVLTAGLPPNLRNRLFCLLARDHSAELIGQMSERDRVRTVGSLETDIASDIVDRMDSDDAADLLLDLPAKKTDAILDAMPPTHAM